MTVIRPLTPLTNAILHLIRYTVCMMSVITAALTIAIIRSCRSGPSPKYSQRLLALVSVSVISDMYSQLVLDPFIFFPAIPCVARFDPVLHFPGRTSTHLAVLPPGSRWSISARAQFVIPLFFVPVTYTFPPLMQYTFLPPGSISKYANFSIDWPDEIIARAECFDTNKIIPIVVNGTICISIGVTLIILIAHHTFATLGMRSMLSRKVMEYHWTITKTLILQAGVPSVIGALLLCVGFTVYLLDVDATLIISSCIAITPIHSFLHSVVIMSTPVYKKHLQKTFLGKPKPSVVLSLSQTITE